MIEAVGYDITEQIYRSSRTSIYRAVRRSDNRCCALKTLTKPYPDFGAIADLKHEFSLLSSVEISGVVRAIEWKKQVPVPILVLEDFRGISLQRFIEKQGALPILTFLPIALRLAEILEELHCNHVVHYSIQPDNILIDPKTREIRLIDFRLAASQRVERRVADYRREEKKTYAYVSPEQTGRMNRAADHRSDLYSLGITFYQMLSGQLPFQAKDSMEWVHCHIARSFDQLHDLVPQVPEIVSQIISKLLAKMAESRYQRSQGLANDLRRCLDQLSRDGKCSSFSIGQQDESGIFQSTQAIYGRENEISTLLAVFERVSRGNTELVLIKGRSGIGKSSLVNEVQRSIVQKQGYFVSSKFEKIGDSVPYQFLAQAFQTLLRQILSQSETEVEQWRHQLQEKLGSNAEALTSILPELSLLLGPQPRLIEVSLSEAQERLNQAFKNMMDAFAQPEHPLVVFMDDLQWADPSSLNVILSLLKNSDSGYLMVVGAYRSDEVSAQHPLALAIERLEQSQIRSRSITLNPLRFVDVNQLVADTLNTPAEGVRSLSSIIFRRTIGNAFFTKALLEKIYLDKQLTFNIDEAKWQWDIQQIETIGFTDNAVDFMTMQMQQLPSDTQHALFIAACLGAQFNLASLSAALAQTASVASEAIKPALSIGLLVSLSDSDRLTQGLETEDAPFATIEQIDYRFGHDKIQEAAYQLLPADLRIQSHWRIGQLFLRSPQTPNAKIFDTVVQLNKGRTLATSPAERHQVAALNWQAGCKSKEINAFEVALTYFRTGLSMLPTAAWQDDYALAFSLHKNASECEYLCGHFERAESLFETVLARAASVYDRAAIHIIRLTLYDNRGEYIKNLSVGGEALRQLGFRWPQTSDEVAEILEEELEQYRSSLKDLNISELAYQEEMGDLAAIAGMELLVNMTGPAYFTDQTLATLVTLKMTTLSMTYGSSKWASQGYTFWGAMLSAAFQDYKTADAFGQMALQLKERYNNYNEAKVLNSYVGFISPWRRHFKEGIALLRHAYGVAVEVGDVFAGYIVSHLGLHLILTGAELDKIEAELSEYATYLQKAKNEVFRRQIQVYLYCISAYQSGTVETNKDTLLDFDESTCLTLFQNNQYFPGIVSLSVLKIIHYFLIADYETALSLCRESQQQLGFVAGMPGEAEFAFYYALVLAARCDSATEENRRSYVKVIHSHSEKLKSWAENCEENYLHRYLLVLAELRRVSSHSFCESLSDTFQLYEQSIQSAEQNGFIHTLAIAHELAAHFCLKNNRHSQAQHHMKAACYAYQQWGAVAKVASIERRYKHLLQKPSPSRQAIAGEAQPLAQSMHAQSMHAQSMYSQSMYRGAEIEKSLDLSTVIKASQAIASQIRLEDLLQTLMQIVVENAGAQFGALVSKQNNLWTVEAISNSGEVVVLNAQSPPLEDVLACSVVNYVVRTQVPVLINDGRVAKTFQQDPYFIDKQPKSLLCLPIAHQGSIKSILYLENNLTVGAFTRDRIEVLNLLSAQIAISLENAKLYCGVETLNSALEDANQTLEKRVEARTEELTQTLKVLKATQSELIIENALLRTDTEPSQYDYQVGGSLGINAPTYVVRQADRKLYQLLRSHQYCYIFNARQMGKSSLRVQMIKRMRREGLACVSIDLSIIGNRQTTREQWYAGFMYVLASDLALTDQFDVQGWWQAHLMLSPVQRLNEFMRQIVLTHVDRDILVFIDEVDSILGLEFDLDDFFAWLRSCFNQRASNPLFKRLTFVLLGVATPGQLIQNPNTTPFNIGRAIELSGFEIHEAHPLLQGFSHNVAQPNSVLSEVLAWTGGQPFLTQKICQLIQQEAQPIGEGEAADRVNDLVRSNMIDNWEVKDEPEHFKTIRDRILNPARPTHAMLKVYRQILRSHAVSVDSSLAQTELVLSGLVSRQGNRLVVTNRLYSIIFDLAWVEQAL